MSVDLLRLGLAIESPLVVPTASNYRPSTWPPARDWPVVIDASGNVVSRWGDSIWRLDPWAGNPTTLNFGDGRVTKSPPIDPANADLLRCIVGWWIWGADGVRSARTLAAKFSMIRPLVVLCSQEGILVSDLARFPRVVDRLPEVISPSGADDIVRHLHALHDQREDLGFTLLDREGLTRLEAMLPGHEARQTPYIPPRIWRYQVDRLRACLQDFLAHRQQIEDCFRFCVEAYARNSGSLAAAFVMPSVSSSVAPFQWPDGVTGERSGKRFFGPFSLTAEKFGIDGLLERWVGPRGRQYGKATIGMDSFSGYLTLISRAGLAYLLNFSLMRIEEGWNLRADCLRIDDDPDFGPIYMLHGVTTKTMNDHEAVWITSPSVKVAVEAMGVVARLRISCAEANPAVRLTSEQACNPFLQTHIHEPWIPGRMPHYHVRHKNPSYLAVLSRSPKLFDPEALRITQQDLDLARLVTPTLDSRRFAVGNVWPLAWHQLRRTGAVNMQASGVVSDASLQFQLKHVSRAMSLYYGRGYARVRLEEDAQGVYVRTLYETLGRELARMVTDRYVSPHGEKRKAEIVRLIDPTAAKKLATLARQGRVACREILLGICASRQPCPYGGIESIAHCGGGDAGNGGKPCPDVLYDREKVLHVEALERHLAERLADAPSGSRLRESLEAQTRSVRSYFDAIKPA